MVDKGEKKDKEKEKRPAMVGWYDPLNLGRTAYQVFISTIFGKHSDGRYLQAIADTGALQKRLYYEVSETGNHDYWFDYVSDVGDGFDSTYTVAYHLTRGQIDLRSKGEGQPTEATLPRGELLIFGGDEVYPTASWDAYNRRLKDPYQAAFPDLTKRTHPPEESPPPVFAIPGNHDWYDSLVVFRALFCRAKTFCGWRSYQNRSYFAIKLPRGWWLFGTDMQLASELDNAQIDYFETIVKKHLKAGDRIILCNAEPHWITRGMYPDDPAYKNKNLGYFEGQVLGDHVSLYVAGDRHYYKRHEEILKDPKGSPSGPIHKIVAGGGGAFLHPTHAESVDVIGIREHYKHKKSYPDEETSRGLTRQNIRFGWFNRYFGLVTGGLYLLTAQAYHTGMTVLESSGISEIGSALYSVIYSTLTQPIAFFWTVLIFAGFIFFTDTHSKLFRGIGGPVHAIFHLAALFGLGWMSAYAFSGLHEILALLLSAIVIFAGGYLIGPLLMGLYLWVALNIFGVHHNEAFSALKIEDYKNFLRFKIDASGELTIYPIGIDRVIKDWKDVRRVEDKPTIVPADLRDENRPFLIEDPVHIRAPLTTEGQVLPATDVESPVKPTVIEREI